MSILIALAAAAAQPCPHPYHYDGDDVHCDSPYWRALASGGGMRLHVINAPEINCAWRGGKPCSTKGAIASRDHLRSLTQGRSIACTWTGERTGYATGDRPVVECTASEIGDLGCAQWRAGYAKYVRYFDPSGTYKRRCQASK